MLKTNDKCVFEGYELNHHLFTDNPILCMSRTGLEKSAKIFLSHFPGTTLYAVKSNPHPLVIKTLIEAGITHFDTASLDEIQLIKSINPTAKCYFNHPIKMRREIQESYYQHGVRDFVVDSKAEIDKITSEINASDLVIQCRLNAKTGSKIYDFGQKFGAGLDEIINFVPMILSRGMEWALSFHVGSQCENPNAYAQALALCQSIIEKIGLKPKYINVGGGFPGNYPHLKLPKISEYFNPIQQLKDKYDLPRLLCEPGRALVSEAGLLIVQIVARKNNKLYINDGLYGALGEVNYAKLSLNVQAMSFTHALSNHYSEYKVFGPTCDSFDTIDPLFRLPENVKEGDWIVISSLGAYSTALSSRFNGFSSNNVAMVR